jgi:hypothetical protein
MPDALTKTKRLGNGAVVLDEDASIEFLDITRSRADVGKPATIPLTVRNARAYTTTYAFLF